MSWFMRFMFGDGGEPSMVNAARIQADDETVARVRDRQDKAREAMGARWIGHLRYTGFTTRQKLLDDWEEAITENAARQMPSIVQLIRRK